MLSKLGFDALKVRKLATPDANRCAVYAYNHEIICRTLDIIPYRTVQVEGPRRASSIISRRRRPKICDSRPWWPWHNAP